MQPHLGKCAPRLRLERDLHAAAAWATQAAADTVTA